MRADAVILVFINYPVRKRRALIKAEKSPRESCSDRENFRDAQRGRIVSVRSKGRMMLAHGRREVTKKGNIN
jgi:hypothetical protein